MFLDHLTELLTDKLAQLANIRLLGDFNMYIEEVTSLDTIIFNNTMEALGLTEHVTQPMHNKGNVLDLVFTELGSKITITRFRTHTPLLDHYSIIIDTNIKKSKPKIVMKIIRETTKLSPTHLKEAYTPPIFKPEDTIDQAYNQLKEKLLKMLDAVAPHKVIKTTEKL